jgi:hypothetical protein
MKIYQNTQHAVLIIYKSYANCFPSGARGTQWLSDCLSITIGVYLEMIFRKSRHNRKSKNHQRFLYLSIHAKKGTKNLVRDSL